MKTTALLRLAWRESRGGRRRLGLLLAAIALGVAALVAINGFTANLRRTVADEARNLLGADLALRSRQPFSSRVSALVDTLTCGSAPPCADLPRRRAHLTSFAAMAYVPRTEGASLVRVRAVQGPWPLYGEIRTDPADAWRRFLAGADGIVVDPSLLSVLNAQPGDSLALGNGRFVILGTVLNVPGDVGVSTAFGPRVFLPAAALERTGLLGFGARAEYETFIQLPAGSDAQELAGRYRDSLRAERVGVRTVEDGQEDLDDALSRLARYLSLVALIALLLGGLGVASAIHVFLRQKRETIAVLRCLGASARQVFAIYLLQAAGLGLLGSALGVVLGLIVQLALPQVLGDLLPVSVRVVPSLSAVVAGLAIGLWVALIFAILPLLGVRLVSPLAALRQPFAATSEPAGRDPWRWPVRLALALSVVGLALLQAPSVAEGLAFSGAIGAALALLWLAALGLTRAVRRWFPRRWPYVWRQGLANLYRPANQTIMVVLSLGFGGFLLSTLFLVQHNLLRDLRVDSGSARPNVVFFDIQFDQSADVQQVLAESGYPAAPPVPIVPMRVREVNGRAVRLTSHRDTTADDEGPGGWAARREYRSTYRDTLVRSERLVAGEWWRQPAVPGEPAAISVERSVAEQLNVTVGDSITWDVQGVAVPTRVTSLREVDWVRFEPNFYVVFQPGALAGAPQTFVTLTRVDDAAARGRLQRHVAERFPNVTSLDLALIQQALDRIVGTVVLAIRFMAAFSLATGALVLIGAVATSRYQRVREAVLLKTLGASSGQVARVVLAEYVALGSLSAVVALVLSVPACWALMTQVFEGSFSVPITGLAGLAGGLILLTVVVGGWSSRGVVRRTPLAVLREE